MALALAYYERLGLRDFYLADLDAIDGRPLELALLRRASRAGLQIWLDAGLRDVSGLDPLFEAGLNSAIAATETLAGPAALERIARHAPPGSIVFGLDLRDGRLIAAPGASWGTGDVLEVCEIALSLEIRRILILDAARIGTGAGAGTRPLVEALLRRAAGLELIVGGGISGIDELEALASLGVSGALVGSALHDGRIGVVELARLQGAGPDRLVEG